MDNLKELEEYMPDSLYLYRRPLYPQEECDGFYGGYVSDVWGELYHEDFFPDIENLYDQEQ